MLKLTLFDRLRYAWEAFSRTHKPDPAIMEKLAAMPAAEFEDALRDLADNVGDAAQRILESDAIPIVDVVEVVTGLYGAQWDTQRRVMAYLTSKAPGMTFLPVVQKWMRDNSSRMETPFRPRNEATAA